MQTKLKRMHAAGVVNLVLPVAMLVLLAFPFIDLVEAKGSGQELQPISELKTEEMGARVDAFEIQVSHLRNLWIPKEKANAVEAAKSSLQEIFELIPRSDVTFDQVAQTDLQPNSDVLVELRRTIRTALAIAAPHPELRNHALDLLYERMQLHAALASGPNGSAFLTTISIWSNEITGWRYNQSNPLTISSEEKSRIVRNEAQYKASFNAMKCTKLFRPHR